ncbi:T7SS effector LXG polymorphic toxin, partial [Listeria seeligeri]
MTKIWDTTKYDNFHSGIKKYTKNTIKDLKKVSKKQQEFSTNNKGTKSKTFDGAKAYMGEVHPSIVTSINRALDEYMRVVDKLESDFEDSVDSAGNVKIDTDMINQLNKDTDRKVEDVYQAHAELQKQIDICNTDSNTMPIVAPLFGPLETNMNTINTHLIKVKDSMDDYDMSHNNALNAYHQLVEATRKAIDAAKTNYTAPNGAIKYSSGAFANSPEGEALSNANYQLEAAKLAELYEADKNKNLNNMRDYVNQLLQDPDRLDREMA